MNRTTLNITYSSSLTELCSINSSFDSGVLRIAYPGENRNGSYISKETFERCINTIYNCPVVCNYNRETNTIGGHDMAVVKDSDDSLKLINLTTPVGCIPESSHVFWETIEEEDGTFNDYLHADVLLWKRQEAYQKIKNDGVIAQSMEITVKDGEDIDGIYHIKDFEFTAFALIGVEPCFESASLQMFTNQNFKKLLEEMMAELKDTFNPVITHKGNNNTHLDNYSMEGGIRALDKTELLNKYKINVGDLDYSIDDFTYEELEEKFKNTFKESEIEHEPDVKKDDITLKKDDEDSNKADSFALLSNIVDVLSNAIGEVKIHRDWGECSRYWYADCDLDTMEVYCWDTEDWILYGFSFSMDGDNVVIDFESRKRKKYVIEDFDEGEQISPLKAVFEVFEKRLSDSVDLQERYNEVFKSMNSMESELKDLRDFKVKTENERSLKEREEIFDNFTDLLGVEAFEQLKENCDNLNKEELEEKCYAIRGRYKISSKLYTEASTPIIKVKTSRDINPEPYGGIFEKYGILKNN